MNQLTGASKLVCGEAVDGPVLQVLRCHAPWPACRQLLAPQPVCEPGLKKKFEI